MAECSFARCQQERRTIRKELQRWTKNMVYILGLERVAEELMGRRKWKLYQDALLPRRSERDPSSDDDSAPAADGPPTGLKIKTIEQINSPGDERPREPEPRRTEPEPRAETILESLIRTPATQPRVKYEEPKDWQPSDMDTCHFCVEGDRGGEAAPVGGARAGGATSPASESDSSSVSGPKSPAASPMLLQHLLQLQAQNPQAIAQFQQMMAALAALNSGLVPPALSQAWLMQRMAQNRQTVERAPSVVEKPCSEPPPGEQPLDLSAKSSSTGGSPPPENCRPKNSLLDGPSAGACGRRAYSEDELQAAIRDIRSGKLGTRRAAVVYGIPRSTLRNKVYKLASPTTPPPPDSDADSEPERDTPPGVILKIPTFPLPDDKPPSPATPGTTPVTPLLPPRAPQPLLLPPSVYADAPTPQHLFTSISDVIAKSISQKFQQPPELEYLRARAAERHVSVIKTQPDSHRHHFPAAGNSRAPPGNNGQPALAGGKGTRPKRGKYRNYDRDSLVEAVKAVQRGEMSVHRAGSYYGVPHSTLEYKVKERHLMRPRKREPKPPQDATKPQPKPPQQKPPAKPFANGMNGPEPPGYPPGYPFWAAPGFAPQPPAPSDLYASHMMRRLRDEAPPANGSASFLEGIIRSSLERPGAALLQRLTEPRAPAEAPSLLRRLAGSPGAPPGEGPPARRPRLGSGDAADRQLGPERQPGPDRQPGSDRQLAAEMRETIQRLRAQDKRPRASPSPPPPAAPAQPAPPAPPAERA